MLHGPEAVLASGGPVDGLQSRHKEGTCSTTPAELFADRTTDAPAKVTRRLHVENKDSSINIYVLLSVRGVTWGTATEAAASALPGATTYVKALLVPPSSFRTIEFYANASVGILAASGTPGFLAFISDK